MHRAAFTVAKPILFAGELQQHGLDFTALSNTVAMPPMRTGNVVLIRHIEAGRDRNRLLITIDMNKARQLALLVFRAHALFEFTNGFHQPIGIGQLFR